MVTPTLTRAKPLVHRHEPGPICGAREVDGVLYGDCVLNAVDEALTDYTGSDWGLSEEAVDPESAEVPAEPTAPAAEPEAAASGGLSKPKPRTERKRRAGGDDEVERDHMGRPRILVKCDVCIDEPEKGRVKGKRAGTTKQCPRCNTGESKKDSPPGWRKISYTRTTTYIDVLEDKEQLMTWEGRMVLIGAALDTGFLKDVATMDPEEKETKDLLNRRAEAAKELAGANKKSNDGTFLHELSEIVDQGLPLPATHPDPDSGADREVTDDDRDRMDSYRVATAFLHIVLMEQLMVHDDLQVAGTPDRVSRVRDGVELQAPDGHVFRPDELIITDLKTGRVDYGALKMAMQLALYSRSKKYDKATGKRIIVPRINQKWGLIMHMPSQGESQGTTLYWVNLELGWEAVLLARQVRAIRTKGRKALTVLQGVGANE